MPVSKKTTERELIPHWRSECGRAVVYVGDCRDVMAQMEPEQFYAVVTDPPYGLGKEPNVVEVMTSWIKCGHYEIIGSGFMGKKWDAFVPQPATWQECVRVMKPGAHMVCFAGTRTLDWMGMSLRFVGLECRDLVMYAFGTGFPKGTNVSKAIDKKLGAVRKRMSYPPKNSWREMEGREDRQYDIPDDEPVTEQAAQWQGWNTTLKPSIEPIILARKPLVGSVAQNTLEHGCGGLNIDDCRVGNVGGTASVGEPNHLNQVYGNGMGGLGIVDAGKGRWPSNLLHDGSDEVTKLFPQQQKSSASVMPLPVAPGQCHGGDHGTTNHAPTMRGYDDSGGAARFFYTVKADDDDRPHGKGKHVTTHPTVKPLDLMKYLVRLVCVRGGTVLDPFMGSGSTGCAAILEGMRFVGIEQSQEYADIAVGRLKLALAERKPEETLDVPTPSTRKVSSSPLPSKRLRG